MENRQLSPRPQSFCHQMCLMPLLKLLSLLKDVLFQSGESIRLSRKTVSFRLLCGILYFKLYMYRTRTLRTSINSDVRVLGAYVHFRMTCFVISIRSLSSCQFKCAFNAIHLNRLDPHKIPRYWFTLSSLWARKVAGANVIKDSGLKSGRVYARHDVLKN